MGRFFNLTRNKNERHFSYGTERYHAFLADAIRILGEDELHVGFSVVFNRGTSVNNVGLVLLRVTRNMSAADLKREFVRQKGTALATNFLSNLGRLAATLTRQDGTVVRRKLDLIVTSLVVESAIDGDIAVRAAGPVYEGAYVSLFSRLRTDGHVDVLAAVSSHDDVWSRHGYEKR